MILHLEEKAVKVLSDLIQNVTCGYIDRKSLLTKGRLSFKKIFNSDNGLNLIKRSSMLSCAATHQLFRQLKFLSEQRDISVHSIAKLRVIYANEILEVSELPNTPRTAYDLNKEDYVLYKKLSLTEDWPLLKYIILSGSNADFFYWSSQDLIDKAGDYKNLTVLKMQGGELHRHIIGRGLQDQMIKEHPKFISGCYVGHDGYRYRSQGELIFGNMIVLSTAQLDFKWQLNTGLYRDNSNKQMVSDFYCISSDLHIEISMFEENGRGSRGRVYEARRKEKQIKYKEAKLNVVFIDSSRFYSNGCIDVSLFSLHIINCLRSYNCKQLNTAINFESSNIVFFESIQTRLDLDCDAYCDFLACEYGLTHMRQLSNKKSYLRIFIKARPDSDDVFKKLKKQGYELRKKDPVNKKDSI